MVTKLKNPGKLATALFIIPGISLFSFSIIVPAVIAIVNSFFVWTSITKPVWSGVENYAELIHDELFWLSLRNNLVFAVLTLIGQIGLGYVIAFLLKSRLVELKKFHRTVMFFPVIISTVVLSFLWMLVYGNDYGILNNLLKITGLGQYATAWLSNPDTVINALAAPLIWQWFGLYMLIFMGALETIPSDVLESAEIDGAVGLKKILYINIPMTYNTLKVAIVMCIAGIMKMFDHILVMTAGGPGNSSMVLALYAYKVSFESFDLGYGSTISVGIIVFSLAITFLAKKLLGGKRYE